MTETAEVMVNGRWPLRLPLHRAARDSWPWFEAARLSAIHEVVEPLSVVWDIGSECGDFAALCASWGADLVMVEPNPKAWPSALLTFDANQLTDPLATWQGFAGAYDANGGLPLDPWPPAADGDVVGDFGQYAIGEDLAETVTLDTLGTAMTEYVEARPPDVISIDVEGAELQVLRGARRVLTEDRPHLFVSIHPGLAAARYGYGNLVDTIRWLMCEYGYPHAGHTHLATDHEQHWWFRP